MIFHHRLLGRRTGISKNSDRKEESDSMHKGGFYDLIINEKNEMNQTLLYTKMRKD